MTFYQDPHLHLHRFCCSSCGKHGDLLQFIEQRHNCSTEIAFSHLKEIEPGTAEQYETSRDNLLKNREIRDTVESAWEFFRGDNCRVVSESHALELMSAVGIGSRTTAAHTRETLSSVFGYGTADQIERALRLQNIEEFSQPLPTRSYRYLPATCRGGLVIPYRSCPDQISGFVIIIADREKKYRVIKAPIDYAGDKDVGGIIGDPRQMRSYAKAYLFASAASAFQAIGSWAIDSKKPCPVMTAVDADSGTCRNLQLLSHRLVTVWSPKLRSVTLRYAAALGAKAVIHTQSEGQARPVDWSAKSVVQKRLSEIDEQELPWDQAAANALRSVPISTAADVVITSRLASFDLDRVSKHLSSEEDADLVNALQPTWPFSRIAMRNGAIEQRDSGWYFIQGNSEELVTTAPFRISQVSLKSDGSVEFGVTVRYQREEYHLKVDKSRMDKSPMTAIQEEFIRQGYGLTTFSSSWDRHAMHISMQFYGAADIERPKPVGLAFEDRVFRTTHFEFCVSSSRVSKRANESTVGELLSSARSGRAPKSLLKRLQDSPFVTQVVMGYAAQMVAESRSERSPLISVPPEQISEARRVILLLGELKTAESQARYRLIEEHPPKQKVSNTTQMVAADKKLIWSLGNTREYVRIHENTRPEDASYSEEELQDLVLRLFGLALRKFRSYSPAKSVYRAWLDLLSSEEVKPKPHQNKFRGRSTVDSVASMINEGIQSGLLETLPKPDARMPVESVFTIKFGSENTLSLGFPKAAINMLLSSWGLPRWNLSDTLTKLILDTDRFYSQSQRGKHSCWIIDIEAFDVDVRKFARVSQRSRKEAS